MDCIHYVGWPELKRLETEREGIDINFKARLVGNDHDNQANGMQVRCVAAKNAHSKITGGTVVCRTTNSAQIDTMSIGVFCA